jgi:hypothetical protein
MIVNHYRGWMGIASAIGGVGWILYQWVSKRNLGWDAPGTAAYRGYEAFSRLMALPLILVGVGIVGIYLYQQHRLGRFGTASFVVLLMGIVLMVIGNGAEFWLFSDLPYVQGNLRDQAWTLFLLGALVTLIGGLVAGIATWQAGVFPRWSAAIFPLTLPLGVASILFGILLLSSKKQPHAASKEMSL